MTQNPDADRAYLPWQVAVSVVAIVAVLGVAGWALFGGGDANQDTAATTPPPASTTTPPSGATTAPSTTATPTAAVPTGTPTAVATDPAGERLTLDDVGPREVAKPSKQISIRVTKVERVTSKVVMPDDVAGPALRITIRVDNASAKLFDSRFAVVNAYYGDDRRPANQFSQPGGRPFPTSIAARGSGSAVYLFGIPAKQRGNVDLEVDLAPQLPVTHFVGSFR